VAALGRGAEDRTIFDFARRHGAIFVTINRTDFVSLASYGRSHPGVIVLPSTLDKEVARAFRAVLPIAEAVFQSSSNMFVGNGRRPTRSGASSGVTAPLTTLAAHTRKRANR